MGRIDTPVFLFSLIWDKLKRCWNNSVQWNVHYEENFFYSSQKIRKMPISSYNTVKLPIYTKRVFLPSWKSVCKCIYLLLVFFKTYYTFRVKWRNLVRNMLENLFGNSLFMWRCNPCNDAKVIRDLWRSG